METDRLEIIIEAEAAKASKSLDKIVSQLSQMSSILPKLNSSGLNNMASGLKQMAKSMESMSNVKTTDFNRLTKGIEKLGSINNSAIYKAGNSIRNFANSLEGIGSVSDDAVKLGEIANGISKLGGARIERVVATLPQLSVALKDFFTTLSTAPNVSQNIINMTNAMANLASNGAKFGSTINGMSRASQTLSRHLGGAATSTGAFAKSQRSALSPVTSLTASVNKLIGAYFTLKYVIGGIASSIKKSMDFTETINLFQTSYKKIGMEAAQDLGMSWGSKSADAYAKAFIDRAQTFNDNLTTALGLDPNTMMNYQAVFAQISSAMGLTANTAENISESFTLLGNDIASLWNINTADAMQKLQAGLTGQVKPLRELGVDITQATLQLTAYKYGITEAVSKMSQAEKVQLRWLTIMDQSSVAFGDMAKTINSPANQLRILKQQWENLSRSIGNVFMGAVKTVLPYINAVVIALRSMIDTLATALGYELPDYTNSNIYTDVTGDLIDVTDATDDATKANEKYKKSVLGIDELHILTKPTSSSGSGSASTGSGNSQLDDAINKKTASYMAKFNKQLENMSNKSKAIADKIKEFFGNVAEKSEPTIQAFKDLWEAIKPFAKNVGSGLKWFYDNVLVPMSTIVIDETVPNVLYAMESALGLLNTVIDKFKDNKGKDTLLGFWEDLQESKLENISDWFKKIGDAFSDLNDFIKNPNIESALGYVKNVFSISADISGIPDVTEIADWIGDVRKALKTKGADIISGIEDGFSEKVEAFKTWLSEGPKKIATWFGSTQNTFLPKGHEIITGLKKGWAEKSEEFKTWLSKLPSKIAFWFGALTAGFIKKGLQIPAAITIGWGNAVENFKAWLSKLPGKIAEWFGSLKTDFVPKGSQVISGIKQGWSDKWGDFNEWLGGLGDKLSTAVGSIKENFLPKGVQIISGIKKGWSDNWKDFKEWLSSIPGKIATSIGSLFDVGKNLIQSFINGFKSINIPLPHIDISSSTTKMFGKSISIPSVDVKWYATGGFPEDGLFMANHSELVGQFSNGKTAVANNAQITAGIEEAAYRGYMRAIVESGGRNSGTITTKVVLEGDAADIFRVVKRESDSYSRRVGRSAFVY